VTDAFDSDVLIYLVDQNLFAPAIRHALETAERLIGSVILLPEVLSKPLRRGDHAEYADLTDVLARFDLKDADLEIAKASAALAAKYGLRAADSIHLATAVVWGAERFHTNNRKDFGPHITEVEVVWPTNR
jgi:predicted nucleic acid-binding protein